jgi:hypothetical protein
MSKITTNNPVLQRNGGKNSYAFTINKLQIFTNSLIKRTNSYNININRLTY